MMINKKTKLSGEIFDIETISTAFKGGRVTRNINHPTHQEEDDIIHLLHASMFAGEPKIGRHL